MGVSGVCGRCSAPVPSLARICSHCGSLLRPVESAADDLEMIRELQEISLSLSGWDRIGFWQGAPLTIYPESMLQDIVQALARITPGSWWKRSAVDDEINSVLRERIKALLLALKMAATDDPSLMSKIRLIEQEAGEKL